MKKKFQKQPAAQSLVVRGLAVNNLPHFQARDKKPSLLVEGDWVDFSSMWHDRKGTVQRKSH